MITFKQFFIKECFFPSQVETLFRKNPQIYKLIINDPLVRSGSFYISSDLSISEINIGLCHFAGELFDMGPEDFTKDNLISLFSRMSNDILTRQTANEIIEIIQQLDLPIPDKNNLFQWYMRYTEMNPSLNQNKQWLNFNKKYIE